MPTKLPPQSSFIHEKFIRENNIKLLELPANIQTSISNFNGLLEKAKGSKQVTQDKLYWELKQMSKEITSNLEEWLTIEEEEGQEQPAPSVTPPAAGDKKKPIVAIEEEQAPEGAKKKASGGILKWVLGGVLVVLIGAVVKNGIDARKASQA